MKTDNELILKLNKVIKILGVCCFVSIFIFVIWGMIVSPELNLFYESAQIYDDEWIRVRPDGSQETFAMPTSIVIKDDEPATIYTILPDTSKDGTYLALNTGNSFEAFLEGEKIYEFDNNISRIPGNITKTIVVPIPLKDGYAGKQLTLIVTNDKFDRNGFNTAFIGSLIGIVTILVKTYSLQFIMAALLTLTSIVTIGIFRYIEKRDNRKAPLIYLAEGILAICLWIIFDSPLFQLVFNSYFVDGITGFMLVTTLGMPFLLYFDAILEYKQHKIFAACELIIVINFIVLTFMHLTGIRSYDRALVYVDLMLLVYILIMLVLMVRGYIKGDDKNHRYVMIGLVGLGGFSFVEIVMTILNAKMPLRVDTSGLFVLSGMIFMLFFAILDQIKDLESLRQQTRNAIAATKAKSDFLANMSHEIRTPINAIMGMNEMILSESDQESVKDYARDINSASGNLLKIINDILDFSKVESGKLELICDNYDFGELIYDVVTLVNIRAENKGLKLNVAVDEQLPSKLYGDDKRVREIITNILNNAVKYTDEGFVNLNISGQKQGEIVILNVSVKDSGQGIRKEDIKMIFDGFSQANLKKNKNTEGTGLGLSITKRLVEMMGGYIDVESEFGKGSTFTVAFPQKIVSNEKMGNYTAHRHASSSDNADFKIIEVPDVNVLVIDDTPLNLKVITKLLSKTKANVTCAPSGEEMLNLIQDNVYDIIFLDHMMVGMDGIETLKAAKAMDNNKCIDTPVIALTANAISGAKEMYLEAGFDDYISKPVKLEQLCEAIVKWTQRDR